MKNKVIILISAIIVLLSGSGCNNQEPVPETYDGVKHELPVGKNSLKVLAIGNSFVDDPMAYFDALVKGSSINRASLCVYSATIGGASLEYWANTCKKGNEVTITRRSGLMEMTVTQAPLEKILAQDWDVVTVQQVSTQAQNPSKLSPHLTYLVNTIRTQCPNKDVVIAWQQVWSYWENNLENSIINWQNINEVVKLTPNYGIDMVIPTGTAIQNARATELNTIHGLTRDGKHLGYGVGRYVAACTWFEALIAPVYGVSVLGSTAVHAITDYEQIHSSNETVPVTDDNRTLCQQCAVAAVNNPFQLTIVE